MEFKKFTAGMKAYGVSNPDPAKMKLGKGITNVNFYDQDFETEWPVENTDNFRFIEEFLTILAVCHTIIVEMKDGEISYNASSPDEMALINAARHFGVVFESRDENANLVILNTFTQDRC